jgi:DNA polymerase-1
MRSAAEREATNAPMQGSAADLMKLAMVRIAAALPALGHDAAAMLLQIHDELIFEVDRDRMASVASLVQREMQGAIVLAVPLEITLKSGATWYDVEPMEVILDA